MNLASIMKMAQQAMSGDFSGLVVALQKPISSLAAWMEQNSKPEADGGLLQEGESYVFLNAAPRNNGELLVNLMFFKPNEAGELVLSRIVELGPLQDIIQQLKK